MFSRAFLIFNSHATQKSFRLPFWQGKAVVWNGIAPPQELLSKASHSKLNLLLIGRFNSWKGQAVLLHAVAQLPSELRNRLSVRLVGSVFGSQMHFADELERIVGENGISQIVRMFPFTPNPYPHYNWADVVVVPSIKPEPFGLVAIEAMAAGCSVIAANHGGLAEIVVDDETGSLVVPGSIDSLTTAIVRYIEDPVRAVAEGNAGRARFEGIFEESNYMLKIMKIITDLTENAKIA
jgi:glycosyltransferase involved in cell wall biosynthesis